MIKKICTSFTFLLLIINGLCTADFEDFDNIETPIRNTTNELSQKLRQDYKYQLVDEYCNIVLWSWNGNFAFSDWDFSIEMWTNWSSRESLFNKALCTSRWISLDDTLIDGTFYPKWTFYPTQKDEDNKDICRKNGKTNQSNQCNVSIYANKIFSKLLNDLFSIQWAKWLWVKSAETSENEKRITDFFAKKFLIDGKTVNELKSEFPKTIAMLDKDQKTQQKYIKQLTFLENTVLFELGKKCWDPENTDLNLYICWVHGSWDTEWTNPYFINVITNEYVNYRLFVDFYTRWLDLLQKKPGIDTDIQKSYQMEIIAMIDQAEVMKTAIKTARTEVNDATNAYPIHVWFAMYQEKAVKIRNNASKLLQPFYALYEKLRNVQPIN